jgi:hypothetical protein
MLGCLELTLNRVSLHLIGRDLSPAYRALDFCALYFFEALSTLSVALFGAALWRFVRSPDNRMAARMSVLVVGGMSLLFAALGVVLRLPPRMTFQMQLSALFLALILWLVQLISSSDGRAKLGGLLLMVPLLLHFLAMTLHRAGSPSGPIELERAAQVSRVALGFVSLLCFFPRNSAARGFSAAFGALSAIGFGAVIHFDWSAAQRMAQHGFGVDLPLTPWGEALFLASVGCFTATLAAQFLAGGTDELKGYGLALLSLGGIQAELPFQVALAGLGFFCLAHAAVLTVEKTITRAELDQLILAAAQALDMREKPTVTGVEGNEVARVHTPAQNGVFSVTLERKRGAIRLLSISAGEAPPRDPSLSLQRRGSPRLGPHAEGRVQTDDPKFDTAFILCDRRGVGAPILDPQMRDQMLAQLDGWLGVWPQRGVQYRTRKIASPDRLVALIALIREIAKRMA